MSLHSLSLHQAPGAEVLGSHEPLDRVIALVASHENVPGSLFLARSRCRSEVARARQLAMYLCHVILGETLTSVGHAFGRDRTTVSHACALIEDMRDDPQFDQAVSDLEDRMQGWVLQR